MESQSKNELLQTISKQKEQLLRYETRLRDVVTAYKGLLKEKEALEASLKILNKLKASADVPENDNNKTIPPNVSTTDTATEKTFEKESSEVFFKDTETVDQLRSQVATLTNSLAVLSAEKSRMEASFQNDKKLLRLEKEEKEKMIKDLQEKLQHSSKQFDVDTESMRSKLIMERHEREKQQNDLTSMIRELQKLLSDERYTKENLEAQLDEAKRRHQQSELHSSQREQWERNLRDVRNELEVTRKKLKRAESKAKETPPLLLDLQNEMAQMKMQHQAAIIMEQQRAADAEERAKRLATVHEERVANLEARLAELSKTVGEYDRLRRSDQVAISKFKEQLVQIESERNSVLEVHREPSDLEQELKGKSEADLNTDVQVLVDKILNLKNLLFVANQRSEKPIDLKEILNMDEYYINQNNNDIHKVCKEEYEKLKEELELCRKQLQSSMPNNLRNEEKVINEVSSLKNEVKILKENISILKIQLHDTEQESMAKTEQYQMLLKNEKARFREQMQNCESEFRSKLSLLEQQLQKQRERSVVLLDEKEHEIKTLKSTFQMFLPGNTKSNTSRKPSLIGNGDDVMKSLSQLGGVIRGSSEGENPHMLHYAHELARRDVEISNLRKAKYQVENNLRELHRTLLGDQEKYNTVIERLQEEIDRLERCKSREGANLEYLKNVVLSFLVTSDSSSKPHMLNAIAAVLKFSKTEKDKVRHSHKLPLK